MVSCERRLVPTRVELRRALSCSQWNHLYGARYRGSRPTRPLEPRNAARVRVTRRDARGRGLLPRGPRRLAPGGCLEGGVQRVERVHESRRSAGSNRQRPRFVPGVRLLLGPNRRPPSDRLPNDSGRLAGARRDCVARFEHGVTDRQRVGRSGSSRTGGVGGLPRTERRRVRLWVG